MMKIDQRHYQTAKLELRHSQRLAAIAIVLQVGGSSRATTMFRSAAAMAKAAIATLAIPPSAAMVGQRQDLDQSTQQLLGRLFVQALFCAHGAKDAELVAGLIAAAKRSDLPPESAQEYRIMEDLWTSTPRSLTPNL
jgi:hypothetical protein